MPQTMPSIQVDGEQIRGRTCVATLVATATAAVASPLCVGSWINVLTSTEGMSPVPSGEQVIFAGAGTVQGPGGTRHATWIPHAALEAPALQSRMDCSEMQGLARAGMSNDLVVNALYSVIVPEKYVFSMHTECACDPTHSGIANPNDLDL